MSEWELRRKDGTLVSVELSSNALPDGQLRGFTRDISKRKQAEQAAASLQTKLILSDRLASVGTLAAGVAHEMNNPLSYAMANMELVAEEIRDIAGGSPSLRLRRVLELLDQARDGAERVRVIVRGLKAFTRADEERRAPLDVRRVLDVAVNMAFNEVRHRAQLVKDYGDVPEVDADEARLAQVFINLIINAAQAIPEGEADRNEIRLTTRTDGHGRAVVEVKDTGSGMPKEVLDRVFEPFFTTKPVGVGTGLGLSICHGIVSGLGGEISADSELGKGTLVRIVLPRARSPEALPVEAAATARVVGGRRGRVLVVDDDPRVGNTLARILAQHDVTVLGGAREARLHLATGERYDVILCDLMMPDVTGMDLYLDLAASLPEQADRMIFVTGGAFTQSARAFLDRVPNERIEKPFDSKNLRALVQRFLASKD